MTETVENQAPVAQGRTNGETAFELLRPKIEAIPEHELRAPNVDVGDAALRAMAMIRGLPPEVLARFRRLPAEDFDPSLLLVLEPAAQTVIHLQNVVASGPTSRLPLRVAGPAAEVRERMLQVLDYHLGRDPAGEHGESVRALEHVRRGQGHLDLANDLVALAGLYKRHADLLAADARLYRPADVAEAEQLAAKIQMHLARRQASRRTPEALLAARAWTFMANAYEEIAVTGRWLLRRDPRAATLFPSLGENRRRRRALPVKPKTAESQER